MFMVSLSLEVATMARLSAASGAIQHRITPRSVLRRREGTCFSSPGDDKVGALQRRDPREASGAINTAIKYSAPDGIRTHAGAGLSRLPLPFGLRGPAIRRPL